METYKIVMICIVAALEIPAIGFLVFAWFRDNKRYKDGDESDTVGY